MKATDVNDNMKGMIICSVFYEAFGRSYIYPFPSSYDSQCIY